MASTLSGLRKARLIRVQRAILIGVALPVVVGLSVILRQSFISDPVALNPDEGELLAQARLARTDLAPMRSHSANTYGPVWPMFLGFLAQLGFPLNLQAAHALSAVLVGVFLWCLLVALLLRWAAWYAVTLWLPGAVALAIGGFPVQSPMDFIALSTGLLPTLILAAALCLLLMGHKRRSLLPLAALVAGVAPLAKLQALPLALLMVGLSAMASARGAGSTKPLRSPAVTVVFGLTPMLGIGTWMAVSGTLSSFIVESLQFSTAYVSVSGDVGILELIGQRIVVGLQIILDQPLFAVALVGALLAVGSRPVLGSSSRTWVVTFLVVGFATCAATGNRFLHYSVFWFFACTTAAALLATDEREDSDEKSSVRPSAGSLNSILLVALAAISLLVGALSLFKQSSSGSTQASGSTQTIGTLTIPATEPRPELVTKVCPPGSRVVVWGWAPELYAYYDWIPPNRFPVVYSQVDLPGYLVSTVLKSIAEPSTKCVISATGAPYFQFPGRPLVALPDGLPGSLDALKLYNQVSVDGYNLKLWYRPGGDSTAGCLNLPQADGVQCVVGAWANSRK